MNLKSFFLPHIQQTTRGSTENLMFQEDPTVLKLFFISLVEVIRS